MLIKNYFIILPCGLLLKNEIGEAKTERSIFLNNLWDDFILIIKKLIDLAIDINRVHNPSAINT